MTSNITAKRSPVYYIGHGAPSLAIDVHEPAYKFLSQLGEKIRQEFQPTAIIVFSAHWETMDVIRVGCFQGETPLIYDFRGFPDILYQQKYKAKGSPQLASRIVNLLNQANIDAVTDSSRGFDHGVWVPLKIVFPDPKDTPIIQVSLKRSGSFENYIKVGKALESLRDEGVIIIGSGSLVHNLRDFFTNFGDMTPKSYAIKFDQDVSEIIRNYKGNELLEKLISLKDHPNLAQAHPKDEHLVPLHVVAGAAGDDMGEKINHEYISSISHSAFKWGA